MARGISGRFKLEQTDALLATQKWISSAQDELNATYLQIVPIHHVACLNL